MFLDGSKVLVVGAGRSGVAAAKLALARGAQVTLTDARPLSELGDALKGMPGVRLEVGGHRAATFTSADLIVLSPGVPPTVPEILAAKQHGVPITGEIELASRFIKAPIVAITGTNGKSTVTSLCGEIARATGRPTFVGGNLGTPLSEAVGTDAASPQGVVVCELSSFQLETCDTFHPRAAVLLNITPDHLDRYPTMTAYADAKMRIIRQLRAGDVFVMNEDDPGCLEAYHRHVGGWLPTLTYSTIGRPKHRYIQSTGDGVLEIDAGGHVEGGSLVVRIAGPSGVVEERFPVDDLHIVGRHNLGNALAASSPCAAPASRCPTTFAPERVDSSRCRIECSSSVSDTGCASTTTRRAPTSPRWWPPSTAFPALSSSSRAGATRAARTRRCAKCWGATTPARWW